MNKTFHIVSKEDWINVRSRINSRLGRGPASFTMVLSPLKQKRSHPQLLKYWAMMGDLTSVLREHGNDVTQEQVSDMMKSLFHYAIIVLPNGEKRKTLKSISDKSDTDLKEMGILIEQVQVWAAEMGIEL